MKAKILLFIIITSAIACNAQTIPNGSFETWSTIAGVETPTGWDVSQTLNCTPLSSSKTTDKADGTYAISLETANCTGAGGIHEGFAISKFPVNSKPLFLNGAYKSLRVNTDSAQIKIVMYYVGVNIGSGLLNIYSNTNGYINFSIPIKYGVNAIPEEAQILCFSDKIGKNTLGNKLWIDKLTFSNAPLTTEHILLIKKMIAIYPNPSTNTINITNLSTTSEDIFITNAIGVLTHKLHTNSNAIDVDISNLPAGIYFVRVKEQVLKFVKK